MTKPQTKTTIQAKSSFNSKRSLQAEDEQYLTAIQTIYQVRNIDKLSSLSPNYFLTNKTFVEISLLPKQRVKSLLKEAKVNSSYEFFIGLLKVMKSSGDFQDSNTVYAKV